MLQKDLTILVQNGTVQGLKKLLQFFVLAEAVNLSLATAQSTNKVNTQ